MEIIDNYETKLANDDNIQYIECKYSNDIDTTCIKVQMNLLIINEIIPTCDLDFYFGILIDINGNLLILSQNLFGNKKICYLAFDNIRYNSHQLKLTINLIELFKILFEKIDVVNYTYEFQKFELIKKYLNNDNTQKNISNHIQFFSNKSSILLKSFVSDKFDESDESDKSDKLTQLDQTNIFDVSNEFAEPINSSTNPNTYTNTNTNPNPNPNPNTNLNIYMNDEFTKVCVDLEMSEIKDEIEINEKKPNSILKPIPMPISDFNISVDKLQKMSKNELKNFVNEYKKYYSIDIERNLNIKLPENVDSYYMVCKNNWRMMMMENMEIDMSNHITKESITLGESTTILCAKEIAGYLKRRIKTDVVINGIKKKFITKRTNILDPFAGNGIASKIIYDEVKQVLDCKFEYIATDFQNISKCMSNRSHFVEFNLDCIDSIEKYYQKAEILLLMCPPPYQYIKGDENPTGFADYFAIKRWGELNKKIVMFIGEMGRTDGSEGMYDYMMNGNSIWKLAKRKVLQEGNDLFGRFIQRELFIFENMNFI